MIIIIGLAVLVGIGVLFLKYSYEYEELGIVITVFAGIVLLVVGGVFPASYYGHLSDIQRYEAFKVTIANARSNGASEAERTAILIQITKWNEDLASAKYWNKTVFDIWIPDQYAELPFLE